MTNQTRKETMTDSWSRAPLPDDVYLTFARELSTLAKHHGHYKAVSRYRELTGMSHGGVRRRIYKARELGYLKPAPKGKSFYEMPDALRIKTTERVMPPVYLPSTARDVKPARFPKLRAWLRSKKVAA